MGHYSFITAHLFNGASLNETSLIGSNDISTETSIDLQMFVLLSRVHLFDRNGSSILKVVSAISITRNTIITDFFLISL